MGQLGDTRWVENQKKISSHRHVIEVSLQVLKAYKMSCPHLLKQWLSLEFVLKVPIARNDSFLKK